MELWGEIEATSGQIKAVLLRFYRNYLPYAVGPFDVEGFAELLRKDTEIQMISGRADLVASFTEVVPFRNEKLMHFAELKEFEPPIRDSLTTSEIIKKATVSDVEVICSLTDTIEEFESSREGSRINLRKTLESGTGRTYYIERNGQVIATASTSAENSMSAMVVAVATHQAYRGQGFATKVVAKLCSDLISEGKSLCLFYDNPQAGLIYKNIGFQDIGSWTMAFI